MRTPHSTRSRWWRIAAVGAVATVVVAGCGGGDGGDDGSATDGGADDATPVEGGEIVYGLEAENANGWCLPEAQLDASGTMVATSIYDTLTLPNEDGDYEPFLAESVEPNETYDSWTITLREGVTFHDGTSLDATVVKNNLDAYRGQYDARTPLLFRFVFQNIASVEVVDDLTLTVTTTTPWPALPAFLWGTGRVGIMAQAQLDDAESCDRKLIGTGPFVMEEWEQNDHFSATKNPDYWRSDADGTTLPYLDRVEFRPMVENAARLNALLSEQLNAMHTALAQSVQTLEEERDAGNVNLEQSSDHAEVNFGMFNTAKPPFDNPIAREAAVLALDREEMNDVINFGLFEVASGPFAPGEPGYLEDSGFPDADEAKARDLAQQYQESTGNPLEFTLTIPNATEIVQIGQFIQEKAKDVGVKVNLDPIEQATLISRAIGGNYQVMAFRNYPGGSPDTQYNWWYGKSPVNFGRFDDPEINELLDRGRMTADPAEIEEVYEEVNREFAKEHYALWLTWTEWNIATATNVHGILGADLPDGAGPFPGLAGGHSLAGAWISD